ncbi:MAG TPA: LuxR C-terminal-related transcriptional regulator [Chloroflexota bacterium]|nr:LuxR C-terminal-related transcriptional regulator [Chloroflexota bacterium]
MTFGFPPLTPPRLRSAGHATLAKERLAAPAGPGIEQTLYLGLLEGGLPVRGELPSVLWLDRLAREQDNLRAAFCWLGEHGDGRWGMRLALRLLGYWSARAGRLAVVAARARQQRSLRRGAVAALDGDYRVMHLLCQLSVTLVTQIGARRRRAAGLTRLAEAALDCGDRERAASLFAQGLALHQALGDEAGVARCVSGLVALAGAPGAPGAQRRLAPPATAPLTPRQREVTALIAQGLTNRQIAAALVISERTASTHVVQILNRLGFHSRAQVAAWFASQH